MKSYCWSLSDRCLQNCSHSTWKQWLHCPCKLPNCLLTGIPWFIIPVSRLSLICTSAVHDHLHLKLIFLACSPCTWNESFSFIYLVFKCPYIYLSIFSFHSWGSHSDFSILIYNSREMLLLSSHSHEKGTFALAPG